MELLRILEHVNKIDKPIVCAIGQFDGLHKGHIALFEKAQQIGKEMGYKTAVITFDPHPDYVLGKTKNINYITPFEIKKQIIQSYGFDYLIVIHFTMDVATTEPVDFVKKYLLGLNVKHAVVGFDFGFGNRGRGKGKDIPTLSGGLIDVDIIEKVEINEEKVASTGVKNSLVKGDVKTAGKMLGRYYEIRGKVIKGRQIGSKVSVPTANIEYDEEYVSLLSGVYATIFEINGKAYPSITNIGHNPSFNYTEKRSLECHVLGFVGDIYDEVVSIKFVDRIRDEIKFSSVEQFKEQIEKDKEFALSIIK